MIGEAKQSLNIHKAILNGLQPALHGQQPYALHSRFCELGYHLLDGLHQCHSIMGLSLEMVLVLALVISELPIHEAEHLLCRVQPGGVLCVEHDIDFELARSL